MVDALDALVLIDNPTVASREMQLRQASGTGRDHRNRDRVFDSNIYKDWGGGGIVLVVRF